MIIKSRVGIGTEAPAGGLEVKDGNIYLSDTDVAHGMTGLAPTNVYGSLTFIDGSYGGVKLMGLSDGDSNPMSLYAVSGHASPTGPIMSFYAEKKNGTEAQALAGSEFAFMFYNYTTPLVAVLGSGNVGIGMVSGEEALAFGTSAAKVLGMGVGTAPTTAPADMAQIWVQDINAAAGYAGLHKRTETTDQVEVVPGVIIKTDTGSPASPYEGLMEINTYDNKIRMYGDAGWRELGTW